MVVLWLVKLQRSWRRPIFVYIYFAYCWFVMVSLKTWYALPSASQTWLAGKSPICRSLISGDFRASHVRWHQRYPEMAPNFSDHFMFPDFVTLWSSNISIFTIPHFADIPSYRPLFRWCFSPYFPHIFPIFSYDFSMIFGVFRGAMACHGQALWSWKRPSLRATLHG